MLKVVSSSTEERFVPLKNVAVQVNIHVFAAEVCIKQIFINSEETSNPIEAVYCFPVEEQAAIYQFQAILDDGRTIQAQIKEKKTAQREYCSALKQGHGAFLLEQDEKSNDIFTISIGSLKPQSKCEIEIHYVQELDLINDGQRIQFTLPTAIAPRYSSVSVGHGHLVSPASTTSKYVQSAPYTISFTCSISSLPIASVGSSSHPIQISTNDSTTEISLSQENTHLDRDIILNIDLKEQRVLTYTLVEKRAIMLSLVPTLASCSVQNDNTSVNCEYIFVVDCSGSMDEENKIGYARQAMSIFLKSLPIGSYFNIFRFGSTYKQFDKKNTTIKYDEQNAKEANDYINRMEADLGGTELYGVLSHLQSNPPQENYSRQIFILTDGEISDVDQVLCLCHSISNTTRIYSFGLGSSPSRALVKGLARVTNGDYLFIPPKTHVDVAVARQMAKALEPCLINVKVQCHFDQFDLQNYRISPKVLPPVHAKQRLNVYVMLPKIIEESLSGSIDFLVGERLLERVTFTKTEPFSTLVATRLAAKSIIADLQMDEYQSTSSRQARFAEQEKADKKQELIQLSIEHQVLSPLTAFIAVETRTEDEKIDSSQIILREVPIEIGEDRRLDMFSPNYSAFSPQFHDNAALPDEDEDDDDGVKVCGSRSYFCRMTKRSRSRSRSRHSRSRCEDSYSRQCKTLKKKRSLDNEEHTTEKPDIIRQVIDLQNFNGLWSMTNLQRVVSLLKQYVDIEQILGKYKEKNNDVILSMVVMYTLMKHFSNDESLWRPIIKKSIKAMENQMGKKDYDELAEKIRLLI